uniref:Uncharacterized protein n=1 Tax=Picea glauca TaxID=3330 RepID=A0A124GNX6_PICGL|nr:hypothetical protein ABT39_MTgene36 [Picea glauca]QHR86205.1 hypothetical protein Q903MT_gene204 [Picea sitchensis]
MPSALPRFVLYCTVPVLGGFAPYGNNFSQSLFLENMGNSHRKPFTEAFHSLH